MNNLFRIKKVSHSFYLLFSALLVAIPLLDVCFWVFINQLPETFITVNMQPAPLSPHELSATIRLIGFAASLLPLSALIYGLINLRKLFSYYKAGVIFSFDHVLLFKKIAKALMLWVILSIAYDSATSVLFSLGNPPGSRIISVGFDSSDLTTLIVGGIALFIAWVMDEARILAKENELTV